jgi:hypothetical protein
MYFANFKNVFKTHKHISVPVVQKVTSKLCERLT